MKVYFSASISLDRSLLPIYQQIVQELKKIGQGEKLKLMIYSDGAEPILESRQHRGKRSYVVVNGGRIVQVNDDAISKDLSTAIYAMIVVS